MAQVTIYKGKTYKSLTALARHYRVNPQLFIRRVRAGWDIEKALKTEAFHTVPAQDHEGRNFPSINAMTDYWDVDYGVFIDRFNHGWSVKDALTKPVRQRCA